MYICLATTFLGQCSFTMGIVLENYSLLLLGRVLIGISQKSGLVCQMYVTKLFTKEADILVLNNVCFVLSKVISSIATYSNPELYIVTGNLAWVNAICFILIGVSIAGYIVYYETMKKFKPEAIASINEDSQAFKWSDFKDLNVKYFILIGL